MIDFKSFLFLTAGIQQVSGHGYAYSPRTRNWFAVEEGTEGQSVEGLPPKEYCPDCLNNNELPGGICGSPASGPSYTVYNDSTGKPMPWISQETYIEGQEITVKHFYTTHHYGHITVAACPLGRASNQACFDNPDNWLEFVRDNSYGFPKDVNYPERAYLKRGPMDFESVFKLPDGVVGEEVLLQWRYITANSCIPEGYTEYFNWAISNPDYNVEPTDWKGANMQICDKYPQDGSKPDGGAPEQFWNCAEVTINSGTPTPPTPATPAPTRGPTNTPAPIDVVPNPSGIPFPCCSWYSDFCEQPNNSWCHSSESNCNTCSGVWRDPYNQPQPTPTGPNPTMPSPTAPNPTVSPPTDIPTTGVPCCSINLKDCMSWCTDCHEDQATCENYGGNPTFWMPWGEPVDKDSCIAITYSCVGHGKPCCPGMICNPDASSAPCIVDPSPPATTPTNPPISSAPVTSPTSPPQMSPTQPPQSSPTPPNNSKLFSTDNTLSVWDAFLALEPLTYEVSNNPPVYALQAEGGAAGNGNVVSESQAYSVLISSIVLASWDTHSANTSANWDDALKNFEGYFNGWKKMCLRSNPSNGCQYDGQWCEDESTGESGVCLPGWKFSGDLSEEEGTGSAPDGDEDAILGMIFAIKALEGKPKPSWYNQLRKWADASCSAFLKHNTVTKGGYRMLKLGSCWGGWGNDGNNPSYHSPGSFKVMRDFHASFPANERDYALPNFGSGSLEDHWNNLINTSYEAIEAAQCPDQGMVPNWSTVDLVGNGIEHTGGTFSGSGTPQWEYGAEAGRTTWRVAIDAALYPNEMNTAAEPYLRPLLTTLADGFNPNLSFNEKYFAADTFSSCNLPSVDKSITSFSGGWVWNAFVYAPTVSSLVVPIEGVSEAEQQDMIDKTGAVLATAIPSSYYHRCWTVIAIMTVNGAMESVGKLFDSDTTPSPVQPVTPTASPVDPTASPTSPPQASPTNPPQAAPTDPPVSEGCNSLDYKNCLPEGYPTDDVCNLVWLPDGERTGCTALWGGCSSDSDCCGEASCFGDKCVPSSEDDSSDDNCVVCDDVPTKGMKKKGKECSDVPNTLKKKCNTNTNWTKRGYCKQSCHDAGLGYPGFVCCSS